jgi:hypothetical protein
MYNRTHNGNHSLIRAERRGIFFCVTKWMIFRSWGDGAVVWHGISVPALCIHDRVFDHLKDKGALPDESGTGREPPIPLKMDNS